MNFAAVLTILGWVLPLAKAAVAALTKANAPQTLIDDLTAAAAAIQKVIDVKEPTRAQVMALDISPDAWGPPPQK